MVNLFPHSAEDTSPRAKASWTSPFWNVEKRVRCRPAELHFMVRLKFQEKHCLASAISQRHIFSLKGPRVLIVGLFYGPAGGQSRGQRSVQVCHHYRGGSSFIPPYDHNHFSIPSRLDSFFTFPITSPIANMVQT